MQNPKRFSAFVRFPFRGLMAPVFTPLDNDQNINVNEIGKYAEYLHSMGIGGVLVNGTTGEGPSLTVQERKAVLEAWVREGRQYNLTVVVQIGGTNMRDVKSLAKHAEDCRVAAILCLADLYYKPSNVEDLLQYLRLVSLEAPHTPLLYYHIPKLTGVDLNMQELLERGHELPTFVGIKYTDTDLIKASACVTESLKHYSVFLGADTLFLPGLLLGFDSFIATSINVFPAYNLQIFRNFNERDMEKAAKMQQTLNNCIQQIISHGPWVSSMKAAMNKVSPVKVGPVREPLIPVDLETASFNFL